MSARNRPPRDVRMAQNELRELVLAGNLEKAREIARLLEQRQAAQRRGFEDRARSK